MTDKQRRLRELPRFTSRTPITCGSHAEFAALEPGAGTRWWIRSLAEEPAVRYRERQGPLSPGEVDAFFQNLAKQARAEPVVIQQFVYPYVAGATLCAAGGVLTEGTSGPAAGLLRLGASGDLLASHDTSMTWQLHRGATEGRYAALEAAHRSIPPEPDALWEWIVDDTGEVFHVDRKQLTMPLLAHIPRNGPPTAWRLGPAPRPPWIDLPDTSISRLNLLDDKGGTVRIASGSPLAHLCSEAVARGWGVLLRL